jgi:hypothetical protein
MILGLAATLPSALFHGLVAQGVSTGTAARVSHLPPVGSLFAAFLGYNPMATLLGPMALHHMTAAQAHYITGRSFFPHLISAPFGKGLQKAFDFAAIVCLLGAVASLLRGGKYHHTEASGEAARPVETAEEAVAETEPLLVS